MVMGQSSLGFTSTTSLQGTIRWMSPELLGANGAISGQITADSPTIASDCYALAMTMLEASRTNLSIQRSL